MTGSGQAAGFAPERHARLELSAWLHQPMAAGDAEALTSLLQGCWPKQPPLHPLFRRAAANMILTGDSLDHATQGSRVRQTVDRRLRLEVSASVPAVPHLLADAVSWLGSLLAAEAGEVVGFVVPAETHRHDMRLLVWREGRPVWLGPAPDTRHCILLEGSAACSPAAFLQATGLPSPLLLTEDLPAAMREVATALSQRQALPVAQSALDGPLRDGQAMFTAWLIAAAFTRHGFSTALDIPHAVAAWAQPAAPVPDPASVP